MNLINYNYTDKEGLKKFIIDNNVPDSNSVLMQLFYSNQDRELIYKVRDELKILLPNVSLIGTSTAGAISDGSFTDDVIKISFSIFKSSFTKSISYTKKSHDDIIDDLEKNIICDDSKLLVIFANTFTFDSSSFLNILTKRFPHIAIAGGNAGDDYKFEKCEVFTNNEDDCDIVIAHIESKSLKIQTKYLLNWQTLGRDMKVTSSDANKVYTIDNKPVIEVYEHYLGKEISQNLLTYGIEFPIIFEDDGVLIARALVGFDLQEGSITFAGHVPQGTDVKFGYANVDHIHTKNKELLNQEFKYKNEAIYVYTCGSRRQVLGSFLNEELLNLSEISPMSGFITYGEFFHDTLSCQNNLLNITTTYVTLNEENSVETFEFSDKETDKDRRDIAFKALTNLISKTSEELDENINYLLQFKNAVKKASIFSVTDKNGIITNLNENFEKVSGYTRAELIGKSHSLIRDPDMKPDVFKDMWKTIKSGKIWRGLLKNKNKNNQSYYVLSEIAPIFYKNGEFREYIAIRTDVTELEEYKYLLKNKLNKANKTLNESANYIKQYENAINASIAILKTDTNGIIKSANDKFCELSGYSFDELIGSDCSDIRADISNKSDLCSKFRDELRNKNIVDAVLTNKTKENKKYVTHTIIFPIMDLNDKVIEYLQVILDITDVVELNDEIINTQKEVVFTMGAIGETRSKETGLHVKRVAEYSYLLAKLLGLSEEQANLLRQASPMHDIGKVGIPDNILNKPGKLTAEEFEIMKTHAELGYEMLKHSNKDILKASATVAYTHHEKYDGSGYPLGLAGEDINIFGRITAVADVFDALGHDRCYKKAWPLENILELFNKEKGKHFDPKLIDLFFDNLEEFQKIQKELLDT